MSKNKYTDEEFIEAVKNSYSIANICRLVGLKPAGGFIPPIPSEVSYNG